MRNREFWLSAETHSDRDRQRRGVGPVRVALLFGTVAVAMALLLPPLAGDFGPQRAMIHTAGTLVDPITTASIGVKRDSYSYTVRRSVLQEPGASCIVSGSRTAHNRC